MMRKTLATFALCAAAIGTTATGTAGAGTALADGAHASKFVATFPTMAACTENGEAGIRIGKWKGYACTPHSNGSAAHDLWSQG